MKKEVTNSVLNSVAFHGEKKNIRKAIGYIKRTIGFRKNCLGKHIKVTEFGYQSETDWEPNIAGVKRIADMFDLGFVMLYDDGVEMFGEVNYCSGELSIIELNEVDFKKIHFDENTEEFTYGNKTGHEVSDFFNILLEAKISAIRHDKMIVAMQ